MRSLLLTAVSVLVFGGVLFLQAKPKEAGETAKVHLRLVDGRTGKTVPGIVRIFLQGNDKPLSLTGLADRLRGLERSDTTGRWYVVPADGAQTSLPRAALRLDAVPGLETALARQEVDLSKVTVDTVSVKLEFLFRPEENQLFAGNTHLHLRNLTREEADEYLRQLPVADGLRVLFIS